MFVEIRMMCTACKDPFWIGNDKVPIQPEELDCIREVVKRHADELGIHPRSIGVMISPFDLFPEEP